MESAIERLALDTLKWAMSFDIAHHSQNGWGRYEMDSDLRTLIQRAAALGLAVEPPYPGYSYLGQALTEGEGGR